MCTRLSSSHLQSVVSMANKSYGLDDHEIFQAFAAAARPGKDDITTRRCEECDSIGDSFCEHDSATLPDVVLTKFFDILPLLSDRAWRYYLPAYIRFALRNADSDLAELLIINLDSAADIADVSFRSASHILSPKECELVGRFLELYTSWWDKDADEVTRRQTVAKKYRSLAQDQAE